VSAAHEQFDYTTRSDVSRRAWWLIGARWDLVLFLGTPLLLLLAAELATHHGAEMVIVVAGTVGAVAHHFPGFLRAYGDRELFLRQWPRLVFAPLAFAILCSTFVYGSLDGLSFIVLMWGVWHASAQVYGMGRVYDAKAGHLLPRTALLDKMMCATWFLLVLLLSPGRLTVALTELYKCGLPAASSDLIFGLQLGSIVVTSAVTGAWILHVAESYESQRPQSITKVVLFAGSIAFWWYANIPIQNVIIGVALFELLHDVHYLAFVWTFKHSERESAKGDTSPVNPLFRKTLGSVLFFIALTVAYGVFFRGSEALLSGPALKLVAVVVLVSTLLHFYTDSFVWNLREKSTRQTLDVDDVGLTAFASNGHS
jgi:hypothetical protein